MVSSNFSNVAFSRLRDNCSSSVGYESSNRMVEQRMIE